MIYVYSITDGGTLLRDDPDSVSVEKFDASSRSWKETIVSISEIVRAQIVSETEALRLMCMSKR